MILAPIDQALLDGEHGPAARRAMEILLRYGEVSEAERFIPIGSAHIDGCLYHGPSSIDFVKRFVDLGGRVRVPTTLNVAAVDTVHPGWHCGPPEILDAQRELTELHERLGCLATLTCAPYQRIARPLPGEDVAWAESNAIVFVNSVLGARTDRYGDFADLCAALTGRVPLAGLHIQANRRPRAIVELPAAIDMPRDLLFGAIGYVVGERLRGEVTFIRGLPADAHEDELKALGASGASGGAMALFHADGITPEADWAAALTDDLPILRIDTAALHAAVETLCPVAPGEAVAAVCLGTPHFSIDEFRGLNAAIAGRARAPATEVYVSTSRAIAAMVDSDPAFAPLRAYGAKIVVDTCTYLAPVVRERDGAILTNSVKYAHYGPGNLGRRIGLMTLERCLRSAETGRVTA
ncbi:MAG: aconitase X catalytic domain-containing protein [Pseudomonadota bacterium]